MSAEDRGWGPGWPNCQTNKWVPIVPVQGVPDAAWTPARIHQRIQDLVRRLLAESARLGYVFRTDPHQCWGAACREIRGSDPPVPSNHSWGLAVDINSARNPLGSDPAKSDIPAWMVDLWDEYGFFWGGKFSGRKDPMHFEFLGTPEDADRFSAKAREAHLGEDRMTPEEKQAFADLKARVLELERVSDGEDRRLDGEPKPDKAGPTRQGWAKANRYLTEPKA